MKKNRLLILLFVFLMSSPSLYAWNLSEDFPFVGMEKYSQELKRNVFSVQIEGNLSNEDTEDDYKVLGSGFLIAKGNVVVGITCEHVISKYTVYNEEKREIVYKKTIYFGLDTENGFKRFRAEVAAFDKEKDYALLIPKKSTPEEEVILKNLVLNESYLGDNNLISEGKGILIIGYPLGLGIEYNKNFPVVKFGIIAQYTKQDYFLIDGMANPGNSGSPVYSLVDGKIIGMVTSFKSDHIPLYDEDDNLVALLPYNSGLSSALPVKVIKEALNSLGKDQ